MLGIPRTTTRMSMEFRWTVGTTTTTTTTAGAADAGGLEVGCWAGLVDRVSAIRRRMLKWPVVCSLLVAIRWLRVNSAADGLHWATN